MSFTVHRETHEATAVSACLRSHFLSNDSTQLIIQKANVLTIYHIVSDVDEKPACHLEEVASYTLEGVPTSIASVTVSTDEPDLLILTFEEAKVAVIRYDPEAHDLATVSLHDFSDTKGSTWDTAAPLKVVVDPRGRCAGLVIFGSKLVVISLKQSTASGITETSAVATTKTQTDAGEKGIKSDDTATIGRDVNANVDGTTDPINDRGHGSKAAVTELQKERSVMQQLAAFTSRVVDLTTIPHPIGRIDDLVFLHNYDTPCLALLHQPRPVWSGRYALGKDAGIVTCISIQLDAHAHALAPTVVWRHDLLPGDAFGLVAMKPPVGGVIVTCVNAVIYLNQATSFRLGVNGYAQLSSSNDMAQQDGLRISLDKAKFELLDTSKLIMCLSNGDVYLLHMVCTEVSVEAMIVELIARSVVPSDICSLGGTHLFIASRVGNSLLVELEEVLLEGGIGHGKDPYAANEDGSFEGEDDFDDFFSVDDEEKEAEEKTNGGSGRHMKSQQQKQKQRKREARRRRQANQRTSLHVVARDVLPAFAPIRDVAMGLPLSDAIEPFMPSFAAVDFHNGAQNQHLDFAGRETKYLPLDYLACVGDRKNGGFAQLQHTFRPEILLSDDSMASYHDCWALSVRGSYHHRYIIFSEDDKSLVLCATEAGLERSAHSDHFLVEARTVFAGSILSREMIVRVTPKHLYVIAERSGSNGGALTMVLDRRFSSGKRARRVSISDPYITVLFNDKTCTVFRAVKHKRTRKVDLQELKFPTNKLNAGIASMCMYTDKAQFLSQYSSEELEQRRQKEKEERAARRAAQKQLHKQQQLLLHRQLQLQRERERAERAAERVPSESRADDSSDGGLEGRNAKTKAAEDDASTKEEGADLFGDLDDLFAEASKTIEEEDDLFTTKDATTDRHVEGVDALATPAVVERAPTHKKTHWLVVVYDKGHMTMFKVPSLRPCFSCPTFATLPPLIWDAGAKVTQKPDREDTNKHDGKSSRNRRSGKRAGSSRTHHSVGEGRAKAPKNGTSSAVTGSKDPSDPTPQEAQPLPDLLTRQIRADFGESVGDDRLANGGDVLSGGALVDEEEDEDTLEEMRLRQQEKEYKQKQLHIVEVFLFGFGKGQRPHLIVRNGVHHVVVYELFQHNGSSQAKFEKRLKLKLRKVLHRALPAPLTEDLSHRTPASIRPFSRLNGCDGVFVCGARPMILFCSRRNKILKVHDMIADGGVTAFSYLNHRAFGQTFLYFNSSGQMRIGAAPEEHTITTPLIGKRKDLKKSVVFIDFEPRMGVYVCCISEEVENRRLPHQGSAREDDEKAMEENGYPPKGKYVKFGATDIVPVETVFSVQLISPEDFSIVPNTKIEFDPEFHVVCMKTVRTASKAHLSGLKTTVAVALSPVQGELVYERGQVQLLEVEEVNPEPGLPTTKNKLKRYITSRVRGIISCLDSVGGFLAGSMGSEFGCRTYIWKIEEEKENLQPIAFYESESFVTTMRTVGDFILLGDYSHGVTLLRFVEDLALKNLQRHQRGAISKILAPVGRDVIPAEVYAVDFLLQGDEMRFLFFDKLGNMVSLAFDADDPAAHGGRVLTRESGYNIGQRTVALLRIKGAASKLDEDEEADDEFGGSKPALTANGTAQSRHYVRYYTLEGATGFISPIPDSVYQRLLFLQREMATFVTHRAGLTHAAYRAYRGGDLGPGKRVTSKTIDWALVEKFLLLDTNTQEQVAHKIGLTCSQIHADLVNIDSAMASL